MSAALDTPARSVPRRSTGDALLLCLAAIWLGLLSGVRPLTLPDEGRYSGVAWDMLRSGDLSTPLIDGMPYFHKPPLFYWLDALSMRVFGMNEWALRAPSLLGAWLALFGMYAFVRRYRGVAAARVTTLVLATLPLFYGGAQFANLDMLVAGLISACVLAGADTVLRRARGEPWRASSVLTGVLAALGILAKGLIGLALPGVVLALWLILRRDGRGFLALIWPPAILAFAVVAVPWCWLMQSRYPEFFNYFFVYQHFERFAGGGFNNQEAFWFYVPVLVGTALPWSLWGLGVLRKPFWRAGADTGGVRRLMALWVAVVVVFFSIPASKLVGYVMPALPPLAFLLAEAVRESVERDGPGSMRHGRRAFIAFGVAMLIGVVAVVVTTLNPNRNSAKGIGEAMRDAMAPGDTLVMLHSYAWDLPFYSRARKPAWVVDNWDDPEIPRHDSWRKELLDASRFDPSVRVLISAGEWKARVCGGREDARYWVWGEPRDVEQYPLLAGTPPYASGKQNVVWRLDANAAFKQRVCGETPTGG
jgi:4-amino-4-deoxy-L-arabinose transferase-like glycosyltransferase